MIRSAEINDIIYVADIFERVIAHEEQHERFTAFRRGVYPTYATAKEAFEDGALYVCDIDGDICACLIMDRTQPGEYAGIAWEYNEPAVIHLLCVRPDKYGMGLGRMMLDFAVGEARGLGCKSMRLDTGEQNTPARHLYEGFGYSCGKGQHVNRRGNTA